MFGLTTLRQRLTGLISFEGMLRQRRMLAKRIVFAATLMTFSILILQRGVAGVENVADEITAPASSPQRRSDASLHQIFPSLVAFALPDVPRATPPEAAEEYGDIGVGDLQDAELVPVLPYVTAPSDTYTRFFEGYREAGGLDDKRVAAMIRCESSWRVDPGGRHLGLAQFDPGTWATVSAITGYTDWRDAYSQGFNVAVWASMISPGTTAGWPVCFSAIDWR